MVLQWNTKWLLRTVATPVCVAAAECSLYARGESKMTTFVLITLIFIRTLNLRWDPPSAEEIMSRCQCLIFLHLMDFEQCIAYPGKAVFQI